MLGINNPWVIGAKWDGFFAQKACVPITENPHTDELLNRLWANGFLSAMDGQQSVSGNFECYWFAQERDSTEPYRIFQGCAFLGQGHLVTEAKTLDLARTFIPTGERIYHITPTQDPQLFKLDWVVRGTKPAGALAGND